MCQFTTSRASDLSGSSSSTTAAAENSQTAQIEDYIEFLDLHMGDSLENLRKKWVVPTTLALWKVAVL